MLLFLFLLLAAILMLAPMTLTADVHGGGGFKTVLSLDVAGLLHKQWRLALIRTVHGHQLVIAGKDGTEHPAPKFEPESAQGQFITLFRQSSCARRFLLRHTQLLRLDARFIIGTANAAHTALLTGAARSISIFLPAAWRSRIVLQILPDFFHGQTCFDARCIIRLKAGTLILTAALLIYTFLSRQAEKAREAFRQWSIRSEN